MQCFKADLYDVFENIKYRVFVPEMGTFPKLLRVDREFFLWDGEKYVEVRPLEVAIDVLKLL
ncbi:hypothetical protein [Chroococcidiopsis sp.]|uniref:hypothetical protein n=1 Tax=Chroococcidiopsis sp. TaxID=3088168 RepID=UPI003F32138D